MSAVLESEKSAEAFGARLKQLRMQKGTSQRAFASATKINYVQYNRYENGETIPTAEILGRLADALGVSVDYLLEGDNKSAAVANLEDKDLLALFKEVEKFPPEKKIIVKGFLEEMAQNHRMKQAYEKAS
jgi:transcriptional regulator with XRE-family HTH domain